MALNTSSLLMIKSQNLICNNQSTNSSFLIFTSIQSCKKEGKILAIDNITELLMKEATIDYE